MNGDYGSPDRQYISFSNMYFISYSSHQKGLYFADSGYDEGVIPAIIKGKTDVTNPLLENEKYGNLVGPYSVDTKNILVIVSDGTNIKFYIGAANIEEGKIIRKLTYTAQDDPKNDIPIPLSAETGNYVWFMNKTPQSTVHYAAIWNRPLSEEEIQKLTYDLTTLKGVE